MMIMMICRYGMVGRVSASMFSSVSLAVALRMCWRHIQGDPPLYIFLVFWSTVFAPHTGMWPTDIWVISAGGCKSYIEEGKLQRKRSSTPRKLCYSYKTFHKFILAIFAWVKVAVKLWSAGLGPNVMIIIDFKKCNMWKFLEIKYYTALVKYTFALESITGARERERGKRTVWRPLEPSPLPT